MEFIAEPPEAADLFEACHDRIYHYILYLVKNPVEAEDLAQDTFLCAYRHHDSLRDPNAVLGWLYRIATHVTLDHPRSRRPEIPSEADDESPLTSQSAGIPSALEIIEREETSRCVQRCVEFLPDCYRAVILLHEAHSLTAPQIAEVLGLSVTTVKMHLHRARRKLQQVMDMGCTVSDGSSAAPCCSPKQ
jgi:RNA polymerase sigma-70 factor, ECF subfamily